MAINALDYFSTAEDEFILDQTLVRLVTLMVDLWDAEAVFKKPGLCP